MAESAARRRQVRRRVILALRENFRLLAFFTIWLVCWWAPWIAGGLLFPHLESPAEIGAAIGFFGGAVLAAYVTGVGWHR